MHPTSAPPPCPFPDCRPTPPVGSSRRPTVIRHSLLRTRHGPRQRWRCKTCGGTFTTNHGTPYHRLRSSPARFDRAIQMIVEGMCQASAARTEGISVSTLRRWVERAGRFAREFHDRTVRNVDPVEIQIDELRGHGRKKDDRLFVFASLVVSPRLWIASTVGRRTRRSCRLILRETRKRCAVAGRRTLIVTDPFKFYAPEVRKTWDRLCVHVESGKTIRKNKIVRVHNELVWGTEDQLQEIRWRCKESNAVNTSFVERLNLTMRRSLACLHRRTNSAARDAVTLGGKIDLLQCYYNFVRPHGSLKFGREVRTPAQQAGLVSRSLRLRDIFLAFRPWARRPWILDEEVRNVWRARTACPANNT